MGGAGGVAEGEEAAVRVRRKEMRGGGWVEWVAAGVAVAVGVGVQGATGGIQLLAAVIYMAMLVFGGIQLTRRGGGEPGPRARGGGRGRLGRGGGGAHGYGYDEDSVRRGGGELGPQARVKGKKRKSEGDGTEGKKGGKRRRKKKRILQC